jgi:hypothetical protein
MMDLKCLIMALIKGYIPYGFSNMQNQFNIAFYLPT